MKTRIRVKRLKHLYYKDYCENMFVFSKPTLSYRKWLKKVNRVLFLSKRMNYER